MGFTNLHAQHEAQAAPAGGIHGAADALQQGLASRTAFIKKVYVTLLQGLSAAGVAGLIGAQIPHVVIPMMGGFAFVSFLLMASAIWMRRNHTWNKGLFYAWNMVQGLTLGGVYPLLVHSGHGDVFWMAIGTAIAVFGSLTAYVFATRKDFNWMGGFLFTMCWGMFFVSIFNWVLGLGMGSNLLYNVLGLGMVSGFILYDTSNVLHHYDDDEHYAAALELAWDFIYLVWKLINLFLSRDRD